MCKTQCLAVVILLLLANALISDEEAEPVFSGPQVGEALTPFKAQGVLDDLAGQEFDPLAQADGKPMVLLFVHELTRPSAAVTRAVMHYAAQQQQVGLACCVIFLSDDPTATQERIKAARGALPAVPIGISVDGAEGPGAYGLNRNMTLTVLVGKENKVTANFPLVQPSLQVDAPRIGRAIAQVLGRDETPTLAQMGVSLPAAPARVSGLQDPNLRPLLGPVISKTATPEDVDKAAAAVEKYLADNEPARRQVGEIATRIVQSGKLADYGTPAAQEYLRKWAKDYGPKK